MSLRQRTSSSWAAYAAAAVLGMGQFLTSESVSANGATSQPMRFDHLTLDDGLSQSNVFAIWQDADGLMWFGTENGLNSYDGYEFTHYKRQRGNAQALVSDYIYDIAADADGHLWLASNGGGLARMDRAAKTVKTFRHDPEDSASLSSNVVRTLLVAPDGAVWAGTRGAGLNKFNAKDGSFTRYRFGQKLSDAGVDEIYALHLDVGGVLWVGTNAGLVRFDPSSGDTVHYRHSADDPSSLSGPKVRAIYRDSANALWVGTYANGLNRFDAKAEAFVRYRHDVTDTVSLSGNRVTSVFEDSAKRLWVGTYSGLNLFDRETGRFHRTGHDSQDAHSLSDDAVTEIFEDANGLLWVGTRNRGVNKWNPRSWSYGLQSTRELRTSAGAQPNVTSFVEDRAGRLWLGTFGDGLHALDRESGTVSQHRHDARDPNSLSDDRVMSLLLASSGQLWIGTMTGGVNRMDPHTGNNVVLRHVAGDATSLSADGVMALFEDSHGRIWVGTFGGGISRWDPASDRFERFQAGVEGGVSSNRVTSFAEDEAGYIWVGTDAGGLNVFDPETERFAALRHDPDDPVTLADDTVYSLLVDRDGTLWVGTQGGGLDRLRGSAAKPADVEFVNLSQADGLPNDVVYGIQQDDAGTLWLSTNYGISRYNPDTGAFKNLRRRDGLQSNEFNFGAHYKSASGELFFGGHNGYNAYRPEEVQTSSVAPLIALTGFFRGDERVEADVADGVDITHKDDTVSFEFAALDYAAPELNAYRYKLEGFDRDWIELGNRRRVTYTNLSDGHYLLRVQAANSDGVWNEAGLTLPVRVSPAPWDTWWAYVGYMAMFLQLVAILWFGHRRKLRREEEYSGRLEEEVRERTQKLVESNHKLKELNQSLQESSLSDPLTGLRNRRFVFEEVSRDLDVVRRKYADAEYGDKNVAELVFMMIDLDNFKPINDTYGHAAGDHMLLEVRDVLLGTCRKSDFVIRWGGDEFVVIAKQAKPGEAEALAERIRSEIAEHSFLLADGQMVRTTCSIGFSAYPLFHAQADDADLDQILTLADSLMYEAKRQRNAWVGMLTPTVAVTSAGFDLRAIEPTSLLFRAKRAGQLIEHGAAEATPFLAAG